MGLPPVRETEADRIRRFWLPPAVDWLFYFVASTLLFVLLTLPALWQFFGIRVFGIDDARDADYAPVTEPVLNYINQYDTLVMMLVWAVFGCLVFFIVLTLQNVFRTARQQVEESNYLIGGVRNLSYWQHVGRLNLLFVGLVALWLTLLFMYFNGLLPWASNLFFSGLYGYWEGIYRIPAALILNMLYLFVMLRITQMMLSLWRAIRPNM